MHWSLTGFQVLSIRKVICLRASSQMKHQLFISTVLKILLQPHEAIKLPLRWVCKKCPNLNNNMETNQQIVSVQLSVISFRVLFDTNKLSNGFKRSPEKLNRRVKALASTGRKLRSA